MLVSVIRKNTFYTDTLHDLSVSWLDTDTSVKSTGADPGGAHPA
jgi:hypothetical protein